MRLPILLFAGTALVSIGWKVGAWCGDTLCEGLDLFCEKWAAKEMKKETDPDSEK
jgi:hypothetical protein